MIIDTETRRIELSDPSELEAAGNINTVYKLSEAGVLYRALKFAQIYTAAVEEDLKRGREGSRDTGQDALFSNDDMRNWKHQGYLNNMLSAVAEHVPLSKRKAIDAYYDGPPTAQLVSPAPPVRKAG